MPIYRKKPVQIEARKYDGTNLAELSKWSNSAVFRDVQRMGDSQIKIDTLEGIMWAQVGDYIVKGIEGEFYPVKPSIFHATYEEVDVHLLGADHGSD